MTDVAPTNPQTGQAYQSLSVLQLQKALEVAHQQDSRIRSPGALDGRWGTNTSNAFDDWMGNAPGTMGNVDLVMPISRGSAGPVYLYPAAWSVLYTLAEIYDASHSTGGQAPHAGAGTGTSMSHSAAQSLPPVLPGSSMTWLGLPWWTWLLIGLGAAGVGGGLWWYYRRSKHRR